MLNEGGVYTVRHTYRLEDEVSLSELVVQLADASGVPPQQIRISRGVFATWHLPETDEEREMREKHFRDSESRRAAWDYHYWNSIKEKYGPDGPPKPDDAAPEA
jgi:hypothetical protein